jgi:hypothetical protein
LTAKVFAIDIERHSQSQFIMFTGQKQSHGRRNQKGRRRNTSKTIFTNASRFDGLSDKFAISPPQFRAAL